MDALRAHRVHTSVRFDAARARFVDANTGASLRGLTRVLDARVPVTQHAASACARCCEPARVTRAGLNQPGRTSRKFARALGAGIGAGVPPAPRCGGGRSPIAHGTEVDRQVCAALTDASATPTDPCAVTAVAFVRKRGWCVLEAQFAVHSTSLHFATAIDLVCTDEATHTRLIVIELKATRRPLSHECYIDTAAASSYYMRNQIQLWASVYAIEHDAGVRVDEALVLRVCPTRADVYPLNTHYFSTHDPRSLFNAGSAGVEFTSHATPASTPAAPAS